MDNFVDTMVKKSQRLSKKEFQAVFQSARAFPFEHFIVKYKPSAHPFSRFGVSCGLKVSKKAVVRNRIRRILYHMFQTHQGNMQKGDYIVIVKPVILVADPSEIQPLFLSALSNIYEANTRYTH